MDSVVKVRRSFLNEVRGFCNMFASLCERCFSKPCNCANAEIIHRAKNLIFRIDNIRDADEERYFVENPSEELFARIVKAIEQAGRPVCAKEIRLNGVYRQRKQWALNHMIKKGRLELTLVNGTRYFSVGSYGNNKTKANKEN